MAETTRRKQAQLNVTWNPDTGKLGYEADGANAMEQIGMLQWAIAALVEVHGRREQNQVLIPQDRG